MRHALALLFLLLTNCPEGTGARAGPVAPKPAVAEVHDAGWTLSPRQLEAWLAYQRVMIALPPLERGDGGLREAVVARARLEAAVRADAGLTESDVDRIEDVVGAVVAQRAIARITGAEALKEFEKVTVELKDAQREQAEKALAELRARAQQSSALAGERARFGDQAVQVVLTREPEVTKTWDALVEARGGKR